MKPHMFYSAVWFSTYKASRCQLHITRHVLFWLMKNHKIILVVDLVQLDAYHTLMNYCLLVMFLIMFVYWTTMISLMGVYALNWKFIL